MLNMVKIVHCRKECEVLRNNERSSLISCTTCGDVVINAEAIALLAV